jgi:hypothetical protein
VNICGPGCSGCSGCTGCSTTCETGCGETCKNLNSGATKIIS